MGNLTAADLDRVSNFPQLVSLLRDKLEWPIHGDYDFEDVVFEYEASELGLKKDEVAKIREIHQLRPLVTSQPWGVFFISLEDKALPVTVLRRILKALILNRRGQAKTADRQAWHLNDLIFAASFGKSGARELAFIHFSDGKATGDLPVMKVLGWNARDTVLKHDYVAATLRDKLAWPDDPEDAEAWRATWASAFELRLNETIRTSKDLAVRLAELASDIRARVNQLLKAEDQTGPMTTMLAAFRKNLIHDLDADGFADMFAQTIAYGMLAARISRPAGIIADNLADMVPKTNPFLKELFGNFLKIGGRDKQRGLDFDELGVRDVVDVLNDANMEAVLRDFGDRNPKEDPVIHFYELFLKEYDPKKRMQRGVFYTPRPVVNFIVRGVDEILRTEFGLPLGLADTSTWAEVAARNDRITTPAYVKPDAPFVQILDPATGTGTFLVEVIDLIHKRMVDHWKGQGKSAAEIKVSWNAYVPAHLLPRLTAFELMMAPYTIAHMKVGLKLSETGYTFGSEERARIFLTNALEPARDLDMEFIFMSEALAHEAQAANEAKYASSFSVVIGNPPYNSRSTNNTPWIMRLLEPYKERVRIEETQIQALSDDYVKFIRLADHSIDRTTTGVVGMITNNGYLDGHIFRDMRRKIAGDYNKIQVVNLHGDSRKKEVGPDGGSDKNVFEIQQGVGILLASRLPDSVESDFRYADLWGDQESKASQLLDRRVVWTKSAVEVSILAKAFLPIQSSDSQYENWISLPECFGTGNWLDDKSNLFGSGFKSQQDEFAIGFEAEDVRKNIEQLLEPGMTEDELRSRFALCASNQWSFSRARQRLRLESWSDDLRKVLFRPFDFRFTVINPDVVTNPRTELMRQLYMDNLAILSTRKSTEGFSVFVTDKPCGHKIVGNYDMTTVFPVFLFEDYGGLNVGASSARVNLSRRIINSFSECLDDESLDRVNALHVANYIYAVLHSPGYRSRYAEFLKSDFPRIPTPATRTTFAALAALGRQLVGLHLLRPEDAPILKSPDIQFRGSGEARVAKGYPEYQNGRVMINASRWFEDVPKATWEFHVGGYQVCEKWLKDRAGKGGKNPGPGRVLTDDDILHYRRVVVALTETRRLMAEIDTEIEKHGGWPAAFKVDG